ncbi:MAG: amidohydrolase [Armatimonadetes bacterium]|nr:amidohydrolase [Armatimonadota bacterium]MBS1701068.1 amidohydrolase [Armatimonadota bacterium]MBS1726399.1 amidohydrolase [Armatimonadota bacterium]
MTLAEIRHDLHAHPQVRFEEVFASELVQRELTALGIEFKAGLARGTGVLGYLPATTDPATAPTIALRADMDALPIHEDTGLPYASTIPNRMHACGHDGHTTILIGAARELAAKTHRPNNILFVFQPAEEGGGGGNLMVQDGCLNGSVLGKRADFMFGLHGWSTVKLGHVATRVGSLMASTDDMMVEFHGQGGHAAAPDTTKDPVVAIAHLVTALQSIVARNVDPFANGVVTVGQVHGGTTHNIIPMSAWLQGTIRAMNDEVRDRLCERVRTIAQGIADAFEMKAEIKVERGYPVVVNDGKAVERFLRVARNELGDEFVSDDAKPTMGGEDFAYYGAECPSCFYQLGLIPEGRDDYASVHTPYFDFNDDAIAVGVKLMTGLALSTE